MRLAFVDLETTGGSPVEDCITEVGIIEVDLDESDPTRPPQPVREWSTLVRPDAPIPPFIETLTGISNAMVADAPRFDDLAHDILARLEGRLFIAHNARFDHGFLKNAFRRLGHSFRPSVLCTVRLSRKLYPGYSRHNLDTLIERHRLVVDMRHRALGDARLLWQLWQKLHAALPVDQIAAAIDQLTARPSLPRHLDPDVLDTLPKTAGVYLFHGEPDDDEKAESAAAGRIAEPRPLYVGKAKNLRQRVMAHFTGDHLSAREMEISQQMTGLEWIETGGGTQLDLGALLVEASLVKTRMPAYNRQLRKSEDVCAWRLVVDPGRGRWKLALARPDDLFFAQDRDLYGPFATPRQAGVALRAIADAHGLCPAVLKLDKTPAGKPCFSHQVKRCHGACVGVETIAEHTARLRDALASTALVPWPFPGAVAFREGRTYHVIDGWAYLGMAADLDGARRLATTTRLFDHDVYRLLVRRIASLEVVRLDADANAEDPAPGPVERPVTGVCNEAIGMPTPARSETAGPAIVSLENAPVDRPVVDTGTHRTTRDEADSPEPTECRVTALVAAAADARSDVAAYRPPTGIAPVVEAAPVRDPRREDVPATPPGPDRPRGDSAPAVSSEAASSGTGVADAAPAAEPSTMDAD